MIALFPFVVQLVLLRTRNILSGKVVTLFDVFNKKDKNDIKKNNTVAKTKMYVIIQQTIIILYTSV